MTAKKNNFSGLLEDHGFSNDDPNYEEFNKQYGEVLQHRHHRWQKYLGKHSDDMSDKSRKLKRFVRKGIPAEFRCQIWMDVSGASLLMSSQPELYHDLLSQPIEPKIRSQINADVPRTFPENPFFQFEKKTEDSMLDRLRNILYAFAANNPSVGYCQGINYIAAVILLIVKEEEKSFWLLNTLVMKTVSESYYTTSLVGVERDCFVLNEIIKSKFPDVAAILQRENVNLVLMCTKWFICLFTDILPFETVLRIWDCLFYEGDKILFRVSILLIRLHAKELAKCRNFLDIIEVFKGVTSDPKSLYCHEFMKNVFKKVDDLKRKDIERLRMEFEKNRS